MRNPILSYLKSTTSIVLMSAMFCCWVLLCVWAIQHWDTDSDNLFSFSEPAAVAMTATTETVPPVKITNELRYTTKGWQNPSHWVRQPTQVSDLSIAGIHPVYFALVVLLASLLAVILCSPDREVERLLKNAKLKDQATAEYKLNSLRQLDLD